MTSEEQMLEELLQANEFLSNIFLCVRDGIILTDPNGDITFVNSSAEQILGIRQDNLLGTRAIDIPVKMYSSQKEELRKSNQPFDLALRTEVDQGAQKVFLQRPDGKTTPLLFNVATADDGQMVAVLTDISEMQQKQQLAEEYFNLVAHDLRTPLSVVIGYAELMERSPQTDPGPVFRHIHEAGTMMQELIEGITDRMRLENENYQLNVVPMLLLPAIQVIAAQHALDDNSPHIHVEVAEDLYVHADGKLLKRALHNLVGNAVKHSPDNSVITIRACSNQRGVTVTVEDEGPGIDREDLPYIFDPFFITSAGRSKGGIGLGLHITLKIAEAHGGTLFVCSEKAKGTTFALQFPQPRSG